MSIITTRQLSMMLIVALSLSACESTPAPDTRTDVSLPINTDGDATRGAVIYKEACAQCHQLTPGLNKKGPQLMNIYGAAAAQLKDYDYSQGLAQSGWVWDAKTLDPYIEDVEKVTTNSKMLADPMPDASERADVIAYLSTLRSQASVADDQASNTVTNETKGSYIQMDNEPIDVSTDAAQKPAAHYQ